jgi:hypothetical protein
MFELNVPLDLDIELSHRIGPYGNVENRLEVDL